MSQQENIIDISVAQEEVCVTKEKPEPKKRPWMYLF